MKNSTHTKTIKIQKFKPFLILTNEVTRSEFNTIQADIPKSPLPISIPQNQPHQISVNQNLKTLQVSKKFPKLKISKPSKKTQYFQCSFP
jgi:hypothetical protein